MRTIEEVRAELSKRFNILYHAITFYRDTYYLNNPDSIEERVIANSSPFIRRTRYAYWFITLLELCKLFKENETFSFQKLLNSLCNNFKNSEWNTSQKIHVIKELTNKLRSSDVQIITHKLFQIRDKYYAHSDRNPEKTLEEYTPEFQEVEQLFELSKHILTILAQDICDTQFSIEPPGKRKASNILEDLYNLEQYEKEKLLQELSKTKINSTEIKSI